MVAHVGGPQADDSQCTVCHKPQGLASIEEKHYTQFTDPAADKVAAQIISVTNTAPGQTPQMVFSVTVNGAPRDILATPLARLIVTVAGPTTDYTTYWQHTIQGSGASGTLASDPMGFRYTFPAPIPATATGSYGVGLEGYTQPGGSTGPRYAMLNPIAYVAVTDAVAVPRRQIATIGQCNNCHGTLGEHGGSRTNVEYCAFCHNPTNVNDERIERFESGVVTAKSVDLRTMVHKIHMGEKLTQPYVLYGFPAPTTAAPGGTPINFGETRFPGNQQNCGTCHVAGSFDLPLAQGLLPTHEQELTCTEDPAADADSYCSTRSVTKDTLLGPTASACLACHDAPETRAHAATNTDSSSGIEACATCHSAGDAFDAAIGHAMEP
jgi:OmcA/MtrC family decaheme c-type cytochrome